MTDLAHAQTPPPVAKVAPFGGKVMIYAADTGAALERWPVDARGMVASGEYTWSPPGETLPPPTWAQGIAERADITVAFSRATAPAAPVADAPRTPPGPKMTPLGEVERPTHSSQATPAPHFTVPVGYTAARVDKRGRR